MRLFLKHITLLAFPVIAMLLGIWAWPVNQAQVWYRLQNNCSKSACLYNLVQSPDNIDVAFVGSSRTMAAVIDTSLTRKWGVKVSNLGYCRPGRNVQFEVLKMLFAKHEPRVVFIEVNQDEDWYGHFDYGNIAPTKEVLYSITDRNPKFIRDVKNNFVMKFDLFQRDIVFDMPYQSEGCLTGNWPAGPKKQNLVAISSADTNSLNQRYTSELYLERMVELCRSNNAQVVFHYLPTFGLSGQKPHYAGFYEEKGSVVLDPRVFVNSEYWIDQSHLTPEGARVYTDYLDEKIGSLIRE